MAEVVGLLRHAKDVVDAVRPPHPLSTQLADTGRSIFEMGAVAAEAALRRPEWEERIGELRRGRGGPRGLSASNRA